MTDDFEQDQLIRRNQAEFAAMFPRGQRPSDSTLGRWVASGTFPAPDVQLSSRFKAWRRSTLRAWQRGEWRKQAVA